MPRILHPDAILLPDRLVRGQGLRVDPDGRIEEIGPVEPWMGEGIERVRLENRILVPGATNVHSHAFQVLGRGLCDRASSFRDWVDRWLYPLVLDVDREACRAACRLAFAEMALSGVTTVGEFWYIHNHGPDRGFAPGGNAFALEAIQAARDVGIRICLLRTLYDRGEKDAQLRFRETPDEGAEHVRALAEAVRDEPRVGAGVAPHSIHGASGDMIRRGHALATELDLPCHVHLAEEEHDLGIARDLHGTTPGRALDALGVVDERLTVVHGCWLDDEEIERLGAAGAGLAYNPCSNMALGDGVTDIEAMVRAGVTVALGTDGACANNQFDVWREARTAEHLQRLDQLRMNVVPPAAGDPERAEGLLDMATRNGRLRLGLDGGGIVPGVPADVVALDLDDLSLQPHWDLARDPFVAQMVFAMTPRSAVTDVFCDGRDVVRDGRLCRIDPAEVREGVRAWERRSGLADRVRGG